MRKILAGAATGFAVLAISQAAQAQSGDQAAAYHALHATPVGSIAPTAPNLGIQTAGFRGHYGRHDVFGGSNTFAIGADFPAGMRTSFGFTFGYRTLSNTDNHFMVGSHLAGNLMGGAPTTESATVGLGYKAEVGYGRIDDTDALAAGLSLPVSVAMASGQTRIVPFLSPGIGWGRLSEDGESASDLRFMLGGGLGLEVANGTGIHLGARRIMVDGADMQYGLGLTLRTR